MFKLLKKIISPFAKMGSALGDRIRTLFAKKIDESSYEELEKLFYEADLGSTLSAELAEKVRLWLQRSPDWKTEELLLAVRQELLTLFPPRSPSPPRAQPHVILLVGVNGSGKTTSLAKLASFYRSQGKSVLIAAGDTFRAASVEQLEEWGRKIGVDIVKSQPGSDPAAVAFDALAKAKARAIDTVLIDTAGRLQNKADLMKELSKIVGICKKQCPHAPHETLLVLDATMGQNALAQAKEFHHYAPLSGIILTKLDGSAKGGIALAIQKELSLPVLWVGTGEGASDLFAFDPLPFINALLNLPEK